MGSDTSTVEEIRILPKSARAIMASAAGVKRSERVLRYAEVLWSARCAAIIDRSVGSQF